MYIHVFICQSKIIILMENINSLLFIEFIKIKIKEKQKINTKPNLTKTKPSL